IVGARCPGLGDPHRLGQGGVGQRGQAEREHRQEEHQEPSWGPDHGRPPLRDESREVKMMPFEALTFDPARGVVKGPWQHRLTGRRAERNVLRETALREGEMDARDLFLSQHTFMHSAAVGGNTMSAAERTFSGLTDEQMRVRPREDLNSLAWLLWHIARVEDAMINRVLAGRPQVFDDAWMKRLAISRRDF